MNTLIFESATVLMNNARRFHDVFAVCN